MLDKITNSAQKRLWENFRDAFSSKVAENFLETLLNLMKIVFVVNPDYRRNIENFKGRYQFLSKDERLKVGVVFGGGRMKVVDEKIERPDITIAFRDGKTLLDFIFSPRQDILGAMLRHDVETAGNLNYLYKFGFMAKQLQLMMPQV